MATKFVTDVKGVLEDTLKLAEDEAKKFGQENVAEVKVLLDTAKKLTENAVKNLGNSSAAQAALESIGNGIAFKLEAIARKDAKEALKRIFSVSLNFAANILGVVFKAL